MLTRSSSRAARDRQSPAYLESVRVLGVLLEAAPDPHFVLDPDGRFVDVNRGAENATGHSRPKMLGKTFAELNLLTPGQLNRAKELIDRTRRGESTDPEAFLLRRKDGNPAVLEVRTCLVTLKGHDYILGSARNISDRTEKEDELRVQRERLRELSWRFAALQETERRKLARELHDEIGQQLTALNLSLEMIARRVSDAEQRDLFKAQVIVMELMERVREISLDLRPSMLDNQGLVPALEWLIGRVQSQTDIEVEFHHEGLDEPLPSDILTAAYRIVQEGLTNVARHSGATHSCVRLAREDGRLRIEIEDKGKGFNPEIVKQSGRSGLDGMQERVSLLNGSLEIESAPNEGTALRVELPCAAAS